jgi:hypothetical protein
MTDIKLILKAGGVVLAVFAPRDRLRDLVHCYTLPRSSK